MNILYIDHYAGSPHHGMEYRPFYLAREWTRAGHRVTIVAASQSHLRARQPEVEGDCARESAEGVEFLWLKTPPYEGNGVARVLNIIAFLRQLGRWRQWLSFAPDVVIASSTYPADIGAASRIARHHGATLVWEVHDLWPLSPMELGGMSRMHPFIVWMQRAEDRACRTADVVVSILSKADRHLMEHGMSASKFVHVPNGIDPDEWRSEMSMGLPAAHAEAIAAARRRGDLLIGYAGSHGVANALEVALAAAALLQEAPVTWLFVGGGPEKSSLQQRVARGELKRVVLLEPVPKSSIPAFLAAMDVLYIGWQRQPLYRFGISPNKLMDYMMAGRPVIHAVEAANDPVAEAGCGLTIAPEDPEALAAAVGDMIRLDAAERRRLGAAGRSYVEAGHLYPYLAKRFLDAVTARRRH